MHALLHLVTASLMGCHHSLKQVDLLAPQWQSAAATADPDLDRWLEEQGRPIPDAPLGDAIQLESGQVRRLVLQRHPSVLAARSGLAAASARVRAAGAWDNPELEGRYLLDGPEQGGLEASLTQTLPISGRTVAARNAARVEKRMAVVGLEAAQREALLEADGLLATLDHQTHHVALAREIADTSEQLIHLVHQRQASALADPLDTALVLADAARDTGSLASEEAELALVEGRLRTLMGLAPGTHTVVPEPLLHAQLDEDPQALLDTASTTRSAWVLAQLDLERAEWAAREASRSRIPEPSIGPAVVGDPESRSLGLSFGIPIPVLAPGGAVYRQALAERDAAHHRLVAESREAIREIESLLAELAGHERALFALTGSTRTSAQQAATLARERYQAGQLDILLMLTAQRAWARLENDRLDLLLAIRLAQLGLERAVGRPIELSPPLPEYP